MVSLNQHFYIFTYSHIYKPHVLKNLSKMNIARESVLFIYDLFRVNRVHVFHNGGLNSRLQSRYGTSI